MSPAHVPSNGTPAKKPQALQACPTRSGSPPTQPRKGELVVPAVPEWGRCRGRVLPSRVQYWGSRCAGAHERCTGSGTFAPRAPISPVRSFLKVQICPNQCTHPVHAPHAPRPRPTRTRPRPVLRCPTVQKTGRFTSPSPISAGYSPPIPKSADFLYPPHQIAPTGRNAPAI